MSNRPISAKVAGIRAAATEWAAAEPRSKPLSVFNTGRRAAKGLGVPASETPVAPVFADEYCIPHLVKVIDFTEAGGEREYAVLGSDGVSVFATAGRLSDLIPWLTEYARTLDE